jgi:hypothetical protein
MAVGAAFPFLERKQKDRGLHGPSVIFAKVEVPPPRRDIDLAGAAAAAAAVPARATITVDLSMLEVDWIGWGPTILKLFVKYQT